MNSDELEGKAVGDIIGIIVGDIIGEIVVFVSKAVG
jgi:tetrahydromethanopterin S-methyltransferase subunit G